MADPTFEWEVDFDGKSIFLRIKDKDGAMSLQFSTDAGLKLAGKIIAACRVNAGG